MPSEVPTCLPFNFFLELINKDAYEKLLSIQTENDYCRARVEQLQIEKKELESVQSERDALMAKVFDLSKQVEEANCALASVKYLKNISDRAVEDLRVAANPSVTPSDYHLLRKFSAKKIQRKYRRRKEETELKMQADELKRQADRFLLKKRMTKIQRVWRARQKHLSKLREDFETTRTLPLRPSTKYDAIIAFTSIAAFIESGKIEILQAVQSVFDIAQQARYRIIAVAGLFDKGKTFVINKLFGKDLPSGKLFTTMGLSFLWVKERRMLVLDSAGVQATVSLRTKEVQPILDAQTTESLLFEMISRIAHHMIFVVNDHTWVEQKYITMMHQKYVQSQQSKELIVIHNLRTTGNILEARELFKRQITSCYDGVNSHIHELVYHADKGEGVPPVHHIAVCDQATAAGEKFNEPNLKLLMNMLEIGDTLGSSITLSDLIRTELGRLLPKFVNIEGLDGGTGTTDGQSADKISDVFAQQCTVKYVPTPEIGEGWIMPTPRTHRGSAFGDSSDYQVAGTLEMQTQLPGCRVVMKTRGVISSLGEVIAHDVSFDPIVNVFDNPDHSLRYIKVECPSVTDDDYEIFDKPNGVQIVIQKPKAIDETEIKAIFPIRQHHGTWEREFVFDNDEGRFEYIFEDQPNTTLDHGVLTVVLRRTAHARKLNKRRSKKPLIDLGHDTVSILTEDSQEYQSL